MISPDAETAIKGRSPLLRFCCRSLFADASNILNKTAITYNRCKLRNLFPSQVEAIPGNHDYLHGCPGRFEREDGVSEMPVGREGLFARNA